MATNVEKTASSQALMSSKPTFVSQCSWEDERNILRSLDPTEIFWNSFHDVGNVMILSVISIVSSHPVSIAQLREAATLLAQRHQVLSTCIIRRPSDPRNSALKCCGNGVDDWYWATMDEPCVDCRVSRVGSTSEPAGSSPSSLYWLEAMAKEQKHGFDLTNGPLWRLRMIPGAVCFNTGDCSTVHNEGAAASLKNAKYRTYVMGCFHHSIMDGVSRQRFWNELCCSLCVICKRDTIIPTSHSTEPPATSSTSVQLPQTRLPEAVQTFMPHNILMRVLHALFPLNYPASFMVNGQRKLMAPLRNPFS